MNMDHVEINMSTGTPPMNMDIDRMASEQLRSRRPSGIGPGAFGAKPTSMPPPMPASVPQAAGPSDVPTQNPMSSGG
jgi:hypothetical protein